MGDAGRRGRLEAAEGVDPVSDAEACERAQDDDDEFKDPRPGPPYYALVVATLLRPGPDRMRDMRAEIVHGSEFLIDDVEEGYQSLDAADSIGLPPAPGIWVWKGTLLTHRDHDGDVDVEYVGDYRRATDDELEALRLGTPLWELGTPDWQWLPVEEDIVVEPVDN